MLLVAIGAVVAILVLGSLAVDEGEVATLTTLDGGGVSHDTQVWVVEIDGKLYLRSASPDNEWLRRLRERPEVVLQRGDESQPEQRFAFHAVPLDGSDVRAAVDRAMAEKYGAADRFYSRLFPRERSVPVLLEPTDHSGTLAGEHAGAQAPLTP